MWSDFSVWQTVGLVVMAFAFGYYVQRIDERVKEIKIQLGRLSLTFLKIENDLSAIQDSLVVIAHNSEDAPANVEKIRGRRIHNFKNIVVNGPNSAQMLRGLSLPDIDDDPTFWSKDRLRRFGLDFDNENHRDNDY